MAVEPVGIEKNNGPGRKIDPGGHGGGGEHRAHEPFAHEGFQGLLPDGKLARVMGPHAEALKIIQLPVGQDVRALLGQFPYSFMNPLFFLRVHGRAFFTHLNGVVAVGPGFQKKDGRQKIVFPQHGQHLPKGRKPAGGSESQGFFLGQKIAHPLVQQLFFLGYGGRLDQRIQGAGGVQKQVIQGHRPPGLLHQGAGKPPDFFQPCGDVARVADGGRQHQEGNPGGEIDHDLLPHHPPVIIP